MLIEKGSKPALFVAMAHDRMDLVESLFRSCTPEQLRERLPDREVLLRVAMLGPNSERKLQILRELGILGEEL